MIGKFFKDLVLAELKKRGRKISRDPTQRYIADFGIDCVLDVGANNGQFASSLRSLGYLGRIESFEPLSEALQNLQEAAAADPQWNVHAFALGSEDCTKTINISASQPSSSFLPLDPSLGSHQLDQSYIGEEHVRIRKLDAVYPSISDDSKSILLKIDTQGFEREVIRGAKECLGEIKLVLMELSLVPNYQGEALIEEMIRMMREHNFDPWWIIPGFKNVATLQLYQVDVFFANKNIA